MKQIEIEKAIEIQSFKKLDSTNIYLSELAKIKNLAEFYCVMADFQTGGKGMGENVWQSEEGKNLLCSFILKPEFLKPEQQFYISKIVALALRNVVEEITNHKKVKIKWPNDIYIGNKKIAGILIENSFLGNQIQHSIIGFGLNVNQTIFSKDLPNPTSIISITKSGKNRKILLEKIMDKIIYYYTLLINNEFETIDALYHHNLFRFERWSDFLIDDQLTRAKVIGTNEYGMLKLLKLDETVDIYDVKGLTWIF